MNRKPTDPRRDLIVELIRGDAEAAERRAWRDALADGGALRRADDKGGDAFQGVAPEDVADKMYLAKLMLEKSKGRSDYDQLEKRFNDLHNRYSAVGGEAAERYTKRLEARLAQQVDLNTSYEPRRPDAETFEGTSWRQGAKLSGGRRFGFGYAQMGDEGAKRDYVNRAIEAYMRDQYSGSRPMWTGAVPREGTVAVPFTDSYPVARAAAPTPRNLAVDPYTDEDRRRTWQNIGNALRRYAAPFRKYGGKLRRKVEDAFRRD